MSLSTLVADDNWHGFDEAWKELIEQEGPIDDLISALQLVAEKRRMPRCLPLLKEHAMALASSGRAAEAAQILGAGVRGGGPPGELGNSLVEYAEAAFGTESWWPSYREISGLATGSMDVRRSWTVFDALSRFQPGVVVFHAAGWGIGEVIEIPPDAASVVVRFQNGRRDSFPMRTAVEIFEVLPSDDLRAQALRDPEGMRRRLKEEPLDVLRAVLRRFHGKASSVALRNTLMQVGITGNAWTSWWRKTRLLAENSEWFQVTGNASRAEVRLLSKAIDPVEGLTRQLRTAQTFAEALTRVRDVLTGGALDEPLRQTALDHIEQMAATDAKSDAERLAVGLLLREQRGKTPEILSSMLNALAAVPDPVDPSQPPRLWELFQKASTAREQERCAELLAEVRGESWLNDASKHFAHAPPGMVKPLIDALKAGNRWDDLVAHYASLLARPLRAPHALVALAREIEEEGAVLSSRLPGPEQRAQALLELQVHLNERQRGQPLLGRVNGKLVALLARSENPLLRRLLASASASTLHNLRLMMQRGVDDAVDGLISDIALESGAQALVEPNAFWMSEDIWTTRAGIARREAELREVREVKIPANREAIARAASYGDLSENAEWEQAIRDQAELTSQASQMERELRLAALLENAPIPEDTVCPGTEVRYRNVQDRTDHRIVLLGPWDQGEDTAYYRAPLPAGMLGKHTGDRAVIQLPSGTVEVEILGISPAPIE